MMTPQERRDKVVADYKAAFEHANGYVPKSVRYWGRGWFTLPISTKKVREAEMVRCTEVLLSRPKRSKRIT